MGGIVQEKRVDACTHTHAITCISLLIIPHSLRVCEQRTVRTTEESEGRLDAVLSGVVQALQRQDATDTVQLQLTNMSHVLTNLSHKIEVVETSMLTGSHEGKQEGKSRNVGGEGNLASPPVGGMLRVVCVFWGGVHSTACC